MTEPAGPFATYHMNPDILKRVLNWIALSNSTAGKSAPMHVIKQPELQQLRNKSDPPFRQTMINS